MPRALLADPRHPPKQGAPPRFHGVPLPYVATVPSTGYSILDDPADIAPWPGSDRQCENQGYIWTKNDFTFAMTYGGPVSIGRGWALSTALAVETFSLDKSGPLGP